MHILNLSPDSPAHRFFTDFVNALNTDERAMPTWNKDWSRDAWTTIATTALESATKAQHPAVAARGFRDRWGQSEYLSLDVVGYDGQFGSPGIIVEHENTAKKVPYCAWKLAAVNADLRVLVAYFDPNGKGAAPNTEARARNLQELALQLAPPLDKNPDRAVLLIAGMYGKAVAETPDFFEVFSACLCVGAR